MPNIVHLPICPFYKYEKRKSICCEDTYRGFKTAEDKYSWMYMYCDSWDWMRCPYAADLNEAYERLEKGDDKALEKLEKDAMRKEMKSLSTKLGRAEKKIERMQKKIDELRSVNKSFTNVNESLEKQKRVFFEKWKAAQEQLETYEKTIAGQVQIIADAYEARLAYMMDTFSDGTLNEHDVQEWLKDKEWAIVQNEHGFEVKYKETEEDGQQDQDVQASVQEGQEVRQQESTD